MVSSSLSLEYVESGGGGDCEGRKISKWKMNKHQLPMLNAIEWCALFNLVQAYAQPLI